MTHRQANIKFNTFIDIAADAPIYIDLTPINT